MTVDLGRLRAGDGPMRPQSPILRCRRLIRVAVQVTFSLPSMWMCSGSVAFLKRSGCTSLGLILLRVCSFAGSSNVILFELSSMERVCHWCSATALAYRRLPHTAQLYRVGNSVASGDDLERAEPRRRVRAQAGPLPGLAAHRAARREEEKACPGVTNRSQDGS